MIKRRQRFALHSLFYLAFSSIAFAQVVDIPDPNLQQVVKDALNLPFDAPITQLVMGRLTRLEAGSQEIVSLTGLEYASNLAFLDLGDNNISDLTPITGLEKLEVLWLWNNPLSDFSPLTDLTNLENVDLSSCHVSDVTPLANLTALTELSLRDNDIMDISPLAHLTQLDRLLLHNNRIEDVGPLAGLIRLTELNARQNFISDLSSLANIITLKFLDLSHCRIVSIASLASLTRLEVLQLNDNQIVDVTPLTGLRMLRKLEIERNLIVDHTPLDMLSLEYFTYDPNCDMPPLPLEPRLENRTYPSAFGAEWIFGHDSRIDLMYGGSYLGMYWRGDGRLTGDLEYAIQKRAELMAINPNMVFVVEIRWASDNLLNYDEDFPYWLRDMDGKVIIDDNRNPKNPRVFIDFMRTGAQDLIVQKAVDVSKCGLFDGIVFDSWGEHVPLLPHHLYSLEAGELVKINEVQQQAKLNIVRRIRAATRPNFLIQVNSNRYEIPLTAPYINGLSMETGVPAWFFPDAERLHEALLETESTLLWAEEHLREPHINGVAGEALGEAPSPPEPTDSPENRRWVRVLTTLSMTHADRGYVTYQVHDQVRDHGFWYDFLKADLGHPVGPKAQLYDEDISGLYIREYTKGWVVYNNSGEPQVITLPEETQGVASGLVKTEHSLPNLDGEMYLRKTAVSDQSPVDSKNPADVNEDGVVNILDLVVVAANLSQTGENDADVNKDGVVNILDLVQVAGALDGGGAAPSAYSPELSIISAADVASWLALAQESDIVDTNFQRGVRFLQQLLAALTPKETSLLPNYPNPFNPETWIAYRLAREAAVAITIYDTKGTLVRRLALGNQAAGYYAARGKAAYWDGRNESGEKVASGIYIYQFRAGDYVASRRMVIVK